MGLLTGFSILSGVEIIYYLLRLSLFSFVETTFFCLIFFCIPDVYHSIHRFLVSLRVPLTEKFENLFKKRNGE